MTKIVPSRTFSGPIDAPFNNWCNLPGSLSACTLWIHGSNFTTKQRFWISTVPASKSTWKVTGGVTFFASSKCGLGLRSGCTSPLMQKFKSDGVPFAPKSPPKAQIFLPFFWVSSPWSTQSQIKPPCSTSATKTSWNLDVLESTEAKCFQFYEMQCQQRQGAPYL